MSLFGTRQYVDQSFASLTESCTKANAKARLSRNVEGDLSLSTVKPNGEMGPGSHIVCSEISEVELPRQHEVWFSPAVLGVAGAGWDKPRAWRPVKGDAKPSPKALTPDESAE